MVGRAHSLPRHDGRASVRSGGEPAEQSRPYREAARYYRARPPYSAELRPALVTRLGWDGTGRLLDVGCGPGVVALDLAQSFTEVVGLDPEERMLDEARAATPAANRAMRWVHGRAEEIPTLHLGRFHAVTFGQSLHWTDREAVVHGIFDSLVPGGALLLIHHDPAFGPGSPSSIGAATGRAVSQVPAHPPIPHDAINQVLVRWLGRGRPPDPDSEPNADLLARTRFGPSECLRLPGRANLVRTVDEVIDNYLSMSFAAPDHFGDRLDEFRADLGSTLRRHTDTGRFWEWPGDTDVLIALKR